METTKEKPLLEPFFNLADCARRAAMQEAQAARGKPAAAIVSKDHEDGK